MKLGSKFGKITILLYKVFKRLNPALVLTTYARFPCCSRYENNYFIECEITKCKKLEDRNEAIPFFLWCGNETVTPAIMVSCSYRPPAHHTGDSEIFQRSCYDARVITHPGIFAAARTTHTGKVNHRGLSMDDKPPLWRVGLLVSGASPPSSLRSWVLLRGE